ncbi:MAG: YdcF family protein [bacterium]|nr:YdcF family protein [bacterium]
MKGFFTSILIALGLFGVLTGIIFFGLGFYLSPQSNLTRSDAIVVISGGQTTTRAQEGIKLYKEGLAPKLIFSGAALDDGPSNAAAMRLQAIEEGMPAQDILVDEDSQNTYQNAVNSKLLLESINAKRIILVTSPYHQRRASLTFKKILGGDYTILDHSSADNRWSKSRWYKTPFGYNISMSELRKIFFIYLTDNYQ